MLGRTPGQQDNLVRNVAGHLCDASEPTRKRTYEMFCKIDEGLGKRIEEETEKRVPHPESQ